MYNNTPKALEYIYQVQKEVALLQGIAALLDFDEKTRMPSKGINARAEQLKLVSSLIHSKMTAPELTAALNQLQEQDLTPRDTIVVRELERQVDKLQKIPAAFMEELTKGTVLASAAWQKAKQANDFKIFKPQLAALIKLKQEQARLLDPAREPYEVLLDDFEEGMTTAKLTDLFSQLKTELIQLWQQIAATKVYQQQRKPQVQFDQPKLLQDMLHKMGLSAEEVVQEFSAHPFTTSISEHDVRFTVKRDSSIDALLDGVHELGHVLYDLNFPREYLHTVIYATPSLGLHESQSKFWENMIYRSRDFLQGYWPTLKPFLPAQMTLPELYLAFNQVRPSLIRLQADEVTFGLHIILRFEIERDLINQQLDLEDAAQAWNDKMEAMLGIRPDCDNHGILQDIHWSFGYWGYFPSYIIGSIYASQIYNQMQSDIPQMSQLVQKQDFAPLVAWLRQNIHQYGKTMLAEDIIQKACHTGLDPRTFVSYLRQKYSEIYGF